MPRRICRFSIALCFLTCLGSTPGGAKERPNVILILTDDQGYGDLGTHGNKKIDTPVMDRLAAEGARFDRFYVSPI